MTHYRIRTAISGLRRTDVPDEASRKPIAEGVIRLHSSFARELLNLGAIEPTDEDVTVRIEGDDFDDELSLPAFLRRDYDGDNGSVVRTDDETALIAAIEALGGFVYFSGDQLDNLATRFSDTELRAELVRRLPDGSAELAGELPAPDLLGELVKRVEGGSISFANFPPQLLPPSAELPEPPAAPNVAPAEPPPAATESAAKPKAPAKPKPAAK